MDYLYIMDYMEQSTMHLKVPHTVHIAAKVRAAQIRTSMNQYVIDLIRKDMKVNDIDESEVAIGIDIYRSLDEEERDTFNKIIEPIKTVEDLKKVLPTIVSDTFSRASNGLCKLHGTPLDNNGKCTQKGHKKS